MINFDELKNNLTHQDIIEIIESFYNHHIDYNDCGDYLMLPTVCHNTDDLDASMKLYYYDNTHLFFCYTHCNSSFDIFELIKKMLELRKKPSDSYQILKVIQKVKTIDFKEGNVETYVSILDKYQRKNKKPPEKFYDKKILNIFPELYTKQWIDDGLTIKSMKKYDIRYNQDPSQVIIPHLDIEGRLVGIRVRNFDPYLLSKGEKYMPARIEGKFYTHPLMYNLYGLYENQKAIQAFRTAWIFEGEKSCIITDGWYGKDNISVATCGNKLNKFQLNILLRLGVKDIVICYDRMGDNKEEEKEYFNKLYQMCQKYSQYANFSFIFDRKGVLPIKAAPVDCGKELFENLLRERVLVK